MSVLDPPLTLKGATLPTTCEPWGSESVISGGQAGPSGPLSGYQGSPVVKERPRFPSPRTSERHPPSSFPPAFLPPRWPSHPITLVWPSLVPQTYVGPRVTGLWGLCFHPLHLESSGLKAGAQWQMALLPLEAASGLC